MSLERKHDVIVVGGGIAGTMAAIAAAQEGRRTLLVERFGCLGGMATAGLVQPMTMWGCGKHYVIGGQGRDMLEQLARSDPEAASEVSTYGPTCDAEHLKYLLEKEARHAGVRLLYYAWFVDAERDGAAVRAVHVATKAGLLRLTANVFIDATGDADLAAQAGVPCETGSQGITLMFLIGGIDRDRVPERKELGRLYGEHAVGYRRGALLFWHPRGDAAYANMTEVEGLDPLDPADLTKATLDCREQAWRMIRVFREHVPGFERAYIAQTAPALGVRESRRIQGAYVLTTEDVLAGRDFPDTIARASCPLDVHGSEGGGKKLYRPLQRSYGVPYGCLVSEAAENLLVAGRAASTDEGAHSSLRRMAPGFALGEAAGVAAGMAVGEGNALHIDTHQLQTRLLDRGAILAPESDELEAN